MSTNKTNKEYEVITLDPISLERNKIKIYYITTFFIVADILLAACFLLLIYYK